MISLLWGAEYQVYYRSKIPTTPASSVPQPRPKPGVTDSLMYQPVASIIAWNPGGAQAINGFTERAFSATKWTIKGDN
jgi:hypothetical protein